MIWAGPTDNAGHHTVSHSNSQLSGWKNRFYIFPIEQDNPAYLTLLVSLEICRFKDLLAPDTRRKATGYFHHKEVLIG